MVGASSLAALALFTGALFSLSPLLAGPAPAQGPTSVELDIPGPAAVSLDPETTAFMVVDILQSNCAPNPSCVAALPSVATGLANARAAGAHVVYAVHEPPDQEILPEVAPMPGEPLFVAIPGDKFYNSELSDILVSRGIRTVVLTGYSANSGVMYTAAGAVQRGYTVVVLEDSMAAATELAATVARWQLLRGPGSNPDNEPLRPNAITLSQAALVSYR
jgi:hypothetical protein